jgi:hypothetical protein
MAHPNKTAVALASPQENRSVAIDRTFDSPLGVAGALESLTQTMKVALGGGGGGGGGGMDDTTLEVDSYTDASRSSTRIRMRAYRHRRTDG